MFIYEKNGSICITFKSNKPVDAPEYVITLDEANTTVYINGKPFTDPVEDPIVEEQIEVTPVVAKVTRKATKTTKETEVVLAVEETADVTTEE